MVAEHYSNAKIEIRNSCELATDLDRLIRAKLNSAGLIYIYSLSISLPYDSFVSL